MAQGVASAKQDGAEKTKASEETPVPTFQFKTAEIHQWLLIGPVPKDARPEDPVAFFDDVAEGKEVEFSDGTRRTWTRQSVERKTSFDLQREAPVDLTEFCKSQNATTDNMTVYAYCTMVANKSETRKFAHGADDGCRIWVDGKLAAESNFGRYSLAPGLFDVEVQAGQSQSMLVEANNRGGGFGFGVTTALNWNGYATFADKHTASPGVLVQLREIESGRVIGSSVSGRMGSLNFQYVPYETEVGAFVDNQPVVMKWLENESGQPKFRVATSKTKWFHTADLIPPDYNASHPIYAVGYSNRSGKIYFVESDSTNRLRVIAGQSVSVHPATQDFRDSLRIQSVIETETGDIILRTLDHGLLFIQESGLLQFGGENKVSGAEQIEAPEGFFLQVREQLTTYAGDAWITVDRPVSSGDGAGKAKAIYRISPGERTFEMVAAPKDGVTGFAVGPAGLAYSTKDALFRRSNPVAGSFESTPLPTAPVVKMCYDPGGRLNVLGGNIVATEDESGDWQTLQYNLQDLQIADLIPGADAWICTGKRVQQLSGGRLHAVSMKGNWKSSSAWADQGVLVGTSAGRIVGIKPARMQAIGAPEGIWSTAKFKVDCSPWGVLLSSDGTQTRLWDGKELTILKGTSSQMSFRLDEENLLCVKRLTNKLSDSPYFAKGYVSFRLSDMKPNIVLLPTKAPNMRARTVSKLSDGKGLMATDNGLFVVDAQKAELESHQSPDAPFRLYAMEAFDDGEVWLGNMDGKICRLADSSAPENWIPLPTRTSRQSTHFAKATVNSQDVVLVGTTQGLYAYEPVSAEFVPLQVPFGAEAHVQDIKACKANESVLVSIRNRGIYALKNDLWAHVDLGDQVDSSMVWDIAVEESGAYWLTTDDHFIRVDREKHNAFCFIDRINSGDGWKTPDGDIKLERDRPLRAELSVSNPFGHAGFRCRVGEGDWEYLGADEREIELTIAGTGSTSIEVQAFDHSHKFSPAVVLPIDVFLPLWRWQSFRWATAGLLLLGFAVTAFSVRATRRARQERLEAERAKAQAERASAEAERARAQSEKERRTLAEESTKERERLLLRVCHDLKNPLNVVFACTEMLTKGELEADEAAPLLNGSAASMDYLSKQLLSYSKAKRGEEVESRVVSVRKVAEDLRNQFGVVRRGGGEIEVHIAPDAPRVLNTDTQVVKEVLGNLLDNAIKHCPEGNVKLSFSSQQGVPTFVVHDSGPGIPASELDSIFDAFYQSSAMDREGDGHGLGLAICRTLAERLDGTLRVESELGHGAKFIFELPRSCVLSEDGQALQRRQDQNAHEEMPAPHFLGNFSQLGLSGPILVIDDQEYVGSTIVQLLNNIKVEAKYVAPADAVAEATAGYSHDVLIDLNMPGRNGFSLAQELRQHCRGSLRLIAMSESEQLVELASQFDYFDRVLPKSRLFEMLGRGNHSPGGSHQAVM